MSFSLKGSGDEARGIDLPTERGFGDEEAKNLAIEGYLRNTGTLVSPELFLFYGNSEGEEYSEKLLSRGAVCLIKTEAAGSNVPSSKAFTLNFLS